MNDKTIPFIRQYDEWAILCAARNSARGWWKRRYKDGTLKVPEDKLYLAENAAKRDPNGPQGAWFPVRPSKRDWTPTLDDSDDPDDGRIPFLPPGPLIFSSPFGFQDGGGWNPGSSSNRPTHPALSQSHLPLSDFVPLPQTQATTTPSIGAWAQPTHKAFPHLAH